MNRSDCTDDELRRALAPLAGSPALDAARAAAALRGTALQARRLPVGWVAAGVALAAAAAGFALGFWLRPPPAAVPGTPEAVAGGAPARPATPAAPATPPAAQLVATVGRLSVDGERGERLRAGDALPLGTYLYTERGGKCSLRLAGGDELHVNGGTAVHLAAPRQAVVKEGEVQVRVTAAAAPFELRSPHGSVHIEAGTVNFATDAQELRVVCLEGSALLRGPGGRERVVSAGQEGRIAGGELQAVARSHDVLAISGWLTELIAVKGDDAALQRRVDALLAQLGETKLDYMFDAEIRQLGSHCVLPLVRFVRASDARAQQEKRERAATLLADIATWDGLEAVLPLLEDPDPQVRVSVFRAVARITGQTFGTTATTWTEPIDDRHRRAMKEWAVLLLR